MGSLKGNSTSFLWQAWKVWIWMCWRLGNLHGCVRFRSRIWPFPAFTAFSERFQVDSPFLQRVYNTCRSDVISVHLFLRFALVCVGSEASSRKLMDLLSKRELHGQNPIVTPCNKQTLSQFEMQSRKSMFVTDQGYMMLLELLSSGTPGVWCLKLGAFPPQVLFRKRELLSLSHCWGLCLIVVALR